MRVASIGKLEEGKPVGHVSHSDINVSSAVGEMHKGIRAPWWMSPYFHSRDKVLEAQKRYQTRNVPIHDSFFE
jgi:hypothetical protein